MAIYRNWKQICKIVDLNLRLSLALIQDEALLRGLRRGFPKCFSKKPTRQPLVPASALRERTRELAPDLDLGAEESAELSWAYCGALEELGIPNGPIWIVDNGNPAPEEVKRQLVGQKISGAMKVIWHGEEYLVSHLYCQDGRYFGVESIGTVFTEDDAKCEMNVYLIPARFIDLNS